VALPKVQRNVQDQQGNIVPGVLGSVYNQGTGVLAALYQDDAGTLPLSNPMTNDATYGSFKFYINPGHYDFTFTKPGYTFEPIYDFQVPEDVLTLGTMATQNANAVAITGGTATLTHLGVGVPQEPGVYNTATGSLHVIGNADLGSLNVAGHGLLNGTLSVNGDANLAGHVGIGAVAESDKQVRLRYPKAAYSALGIQPTDNDTGGGSAVLFLSSVGANVGTIFTTATTTAYNTSSDRRLKDAIEALPGGVETVRALRPVQFRWRADGSRGSGFVADEVHQVVPEAVSGQPDAVDAMGQILPQGLDLSKLVPYLTAAVQTLATQVETLTARVATLEQARGA
jgi:hypothetical protein